MEISGGLRHEPWEISVPHRINKEAAEPGPINHIELRDELQNLLRAEGNSWRGDTTVNIELWLAVTINITV